ncbi:Kinase, NEK [Giardia muris]|uniref:non-specific serine/threonine protein kinase n=1 Tax=Giardia muris TaxID=5742 RepID=A0A4Z1SSR6_GIAMU|nr:Kinase, NEK [Giardia muris]|eukprot:TNJ28966.1 Kinase, NEK [Giardia muris]
MSSTVGDPGSRGRMIRFTSLDDFRVMSTIRPARPGRILLAMYLKGERLVVIKENPPQKGEPPDECLREAETLIALGPHTNIITLLGYTRCSRIGLIALEYCQHGDLRRQLVRRAELRVPFPEEFIWAVLLNIADALRQVHKAGYVFRDVQLSNILLREVDYTVTSSLRLPLVEPSKLVRIANLQFVLSDFVACRKLPPQRSSVSPSRQDKGDSAISLLQTLDDIDRNSNALSPELGTGASRSGPPTRAGNIALEGGAKSSQISNRTFRMAAEYNTMTSRVSSDSIINPNVRAAMRAASRSSSPVATRRVPGRRSVRISEAIAGEGSAPMKQPHCPQAQDDSNLRSAPPTYAPSSMSRSSSPTRPSNASSSPSRRNSLDHDKFDEMVYFRKCTQSDRFEQAEQTKAVRRELQKVRNIFEQGYDLYGQAAGEDDISFQMIRSPTRARGGGRSSGPVSARSMIGTAMLGVRTAEPTDGSTSPRKSSSPSRTSSPDVSGRPHSRPPPAKPFGVPEEQQLLRDLEGLWEREDVACNPENPLYPARLTATLDTYAPRTRDALPVDKDGTSIWAYAYRVSIKPETAGEQARSLVVLGTPDYMPREMLEGPQAYSVDIYALGASALELMALKRFKDITNKADSAFPYSSKLLCLVFRMLGPPKDRPRADEVFDIALRMVNAAGKCHYGEKAILTFDDVIHERGCKMIPELQMPIYVNIESRCSKSRQSRASYRSPFTDMTSMTSNQQSRTATACEAGPAAQSPSAFDEAPRTILTADALLEMQRRPPKIAPLKTSTTSTAKATVQEDTYLGERTVVEFNSEMRELEHLELPLPRPPSPSKTRLTQFLKQVGRGRPGPFSEMGSVETRRALDPVADFLPDKDAVIFQVGADRQLQQLERSPVRDRLEPIQAHGFNIPNTRGGSKVLTHKQDVELRKKQDMGIRKAAVVARSPNRIPGMRSRPSIDLAFGAVAGVVTPSQRPSIAHRTAK